MSAVKVDKDYLIGSEVVIETDCLPILGMISGCVDSDMSANVDTNRSTSGYMITYAGGVVSWPSRLKTFAALSTMEAEYMEVVEAGKKLIW